MELVYLWVEEYKNIHEQGFNFSPKFHCNYDVKTNKLTIDDNPNYIENFFGDNINVTAIVGKNGSGKSSIIRRISWDYILINDDSNLCAVGFRENNFKNIPINFQKSIIYVNSDLMQPSEFDCGACDAVYPSNNNLYKLMESSGSLENNFNSENFYRNFQTLMIEYANIFSTNIFSYNPSYVKLYINEDVAWEDNIRTTIENDDVENFISFLKQNKNSKIDIEEFKESFFRYKDSFYKVDNEKIRIEIYDNIERQYFHLSQGERKVFTELLMIYDAIYKHTNNNLLLILDEPDLTLHPDWQKKYFKELISILKLLEKNIHLIVTTHSPFLLSDIPKQNIIFLDTDEEGKCKVLKHDEVMNKKQTFGANIHTLLSDSFFIDDGLMGEFAKGKINEIIDFHKIVAKEKHKECLIKIYNKRKKNLWQTQSIIGEEYLKQVIKNHLIEIEKILLGKDKAKEEEIKRTKEYLKSLEDE